MRSYPRQVHLPGDPGGPATRGRPVRLALLAMSTFFVGLAVPGSAIELPGVTQKAAAVTAVTYLGKTRGTPGLASSRSGDYYAAPVRTARPVIVKPARKPRPRRPWLPTGTGMWIHEWPKTQHGNAAQVVKRAKAYGITTLYVRTGTLKGGFDGAPILRRLLPATRGTHVKVVAWDFPTLAHPTADARRLAAAARYRAPGRGTPRVAAVAPDIETGAEGTRSSAERVALYLRTLHRLLPHTPILSTVPWPSELRRGRFPYTTVARYSTAIMPMAYWYNRNPAAVTQYSIRWLRRYHRPVFPVGQGYDSHIDAPYLPHSHQSREVALFFRAALRNHVTAVSLWSWQTAGKAQWRALAKYRHSFGPQPRHPRKHPGRRRAHRTTDVPVPVRPRRVVPAHLGAGQLALRRKCPTSGVRC
jgi:hypothetical protein